MARSHAKRSRKKKPTKHYPSAYAWLTTGVLIGIFVLGLVYLKSKPPAAQLKKFATVASEKKKQSPHFDFYTILPKMDVATNNDEKTKPAAETTPKAVPLEEKTTAESHYILQVASFKNSTEASRLKAELLLMGFDVNVIRTQAGSAGWNRVEVGPYVSIGDAQKAQQRLVQENFTSILRKT